MVLKGLENQPKLHRRTQNSQQPGVFQTRQYSLTLSWPETGWGCTVLSLGVTLDSFVTAEAGWYDFQNPKKG